MSNPLRQLADHGQSFWLDNLSRTMITSGELARLIHEDGLRGITSNPTIFEKALAGTDEYDMEIERALAEGQSNEAIFEALAINDIRMAADLLRPIYDETNGGDGFVSLELPPYLATDTQRSINEAQRLFAALERPNVMIKVPGTPAGIPAVEDLIAAGVNVNITLLFAIEDYEQVMEAYLKGIERRIGAGQPVDRIASVASFFVSRVDTEVDGRIEQLLAETEDPDQRARLEGLAGKVAIANAKVAYQRFKANFLESKRFRTLQEQHGACLQRPLWASTSTKNPNYRDVVYIEALIGPHTVETMAPASVDAFRDHGVVRATLEEGVEEAAQTLQTLNEVGISYEDVTKTLQLKGVDAFVKSFDGLLAGIDQKRSVLAAHQGGGQNTPRPFDLEAQTAITQLIEQQAVERLWQRDATLWSDDPTVQRKIGDRLGWLNVHETMLEQVQRFDDLAPDVRQAGFRTAVLLGMGGSSLAPEVFQRTFGNQVGYPALVVLDTTNPNTIEQVAASLDLPQTLFIVSSKSGTTVETLSLFEFFHQRLSDIGVDPGKQFIAITDPGTKLEQIAREAGFRHIFLNPPDIGGRYSALSYFGLVPAAVIGLDVRDLLRRASTMVPQLQRADTENPGLQLGAMLAELAKQGRDKVTFIFDPAVASLADWLEQLIAESTGKDGTGIVPIAHEPHAAPGAYGPDRVFVGLNLRPQPHAETDAMLQGLETAGHPVIRLELHDRRGLGGEFLRWEVATAIAGAALGINPFDEPNVQESKDNTNQLLDEYRRRGELVEPAPSATTGSVGVAGVTAATISAAVDQFLTQVHAGDYLAIMAFADRDPEFDVRIQELRQLLLERLNVATTLGYGPRFLHSTGQLYKGGPANGAFLQIVAEPRQDLPIPGSDYSFSTLFRAQALGDYQALERRGRPLIRVMLNGDTVDGIDRVLQAVTTAATH